VKVLYLVDKYPNSSQPKRGKYPAIREMMLAKGWSVYMVAFAAQKSNSSWKWEHNMLTSEKLKKVSSYVIKNFLYHNLVDFAQLFFRRWFNRLNLSKVIGKLVYFEVKLRVEHLILDNGIPDIIHLYGTQAHTSFLGPKLASHFAEKYKIPLVFNVHGSDGYSFKVGEIPKPIMDCFRKSRVFVPVSEPLAHYWQSLASEIRNLKMEVVPNPVSDKVFHFQEKSNKEKAFNIVHISTLDSNKNIDVIIKAFDQFNREVPHSNLTLIGNKNLDAKAKLRLKESTNASAISVLGKKSRKELAQILMQSHLYLQASTLETFGIPIVEAMMCGIPVLVTRSGAPESYITENSGIVLDAPNADEMGKAILKIYSNYHNFNGKKIRAYAVEKFNEEAVANQLNSLYKKTILNGA